MREFLLKVLLFFVIVVILDYSFGIVCNYLVLCAHSGATARVQEVVNNNNANILIMGSSRCVCHYNDRLMSDSLGIKVINAGEKGNGIVLMYGLYHIIPRDLKPQVLIYDVEPTFDGFVYDKDDNNRRYLTGLKPFFYRPGVSSIFFKVDKKEFFKMRSRMYQYNSSFFTLLHDFFRGDNYNYSSYLPSDKKYTNIVNKKIEPVRDNIKLFYFEQLIEETRNDGVKLIVVASPKYGASDNNDLELFKSLCHEHDIEFWDYYLEMHSIRWFCDNMHLNYCGSQEFTKEIINRLKNDKIIK